MAARILFVHAHPDDETITTGGVIAKYAAAGAQVRVVTCTLGEEGESFAPWSGLTAGEADQLGGYRIGELATALKVLGAQEPHFLGGPGRWRDSGMADSAGPTHPRAFAAAALTELVTALRAELRSFRPHVVVTYGPDGGYGHPDHIQAHRVTAEAVRTAAMPGWAGVGKFYWTVTDSAVLHHAVGRLRKLPKDWRRPEPGELPAVPSAEVTTRVDVSLVLEQRVAALRAHATQLQVAPNGQAFALTNKLAQPILSEESFVLAGGTLARPAEAGPETELLAGLEQAK